MPRNKIVFKYDAYNNRMAYLTPFYFKICLYYAEMVSFSEGEGKLFALVVVLGKNKGKGTRKRSSICYLIKMRRFMLSK